MIKITLADGSVRETEDGSSVLDAAKSISRRTGERSSGRKGKRRDPGLEYEQCSPEDWYAGNSEVFR